MSRTKKELWGGTGLRVFISHSHMDRAQASELKTQLNLLGVQAFVAHEDIEPTRQWLEEMRMALDSMHILAALVTKDFKSSSWTDQEVGYAVARDVPVIPIKLGLTPYGFMGDVQALRGRDAESVWAKAVVRFAFQQSELSIVCFRSLLNAFENCPRYQVADTLRNEILPMVDKWTPKREERFAERYNSNSQVYEAVRHRSARFVTDLNQRATGHFSLKKDYKLEWIPF